MLDGRRLGADPGSMLDPSSDTALAVASAPRPDPRRRLLDAMIETVAARGYDRTTVSRVCLGANMQEAVFAEHFSDKHDCFMQAVDDLIGNAERSALDHFQRTVTWHERLSFALESLLHALANNPNGARVLLVEMLGAGPAACERQRSALALFASLVEQGRESSGADHLPPQTSEAVVGGIASILHRRVLQGSTAKLPSLHADLTYFALLPYVDHERALAFAGLSKD